MGRWWFVQVKGVGCQGERVNFGAHCMLKLLYIPYLKLNSGNEKIVRGRLAFSQEVVVSVGLRYWYYSAPVKRMCSQVLFCWQ